MHGPENHKNIQSNDKGFFQRFYLWDDTVAYRCNGTPIADIIDAFKHSKTINKTYSYTDIGNTFSVNKTFNSNGKFIAYITGHYHANYIGYYKQYSDQLVICTSCSAFYTNRNGMDFTTVQDDARFVGEKSEDCFHVYSIDLENSFVKVIRVGSTRNDRLEERTVAYYDF